ncbi:unnamed protein product [Adineta ricciae]|uniref:Uncharacterized protein n=1 Tax=Adineta ricciae TaxID=249248 RepID=A0A815E2E7_ADIRI|nr:unnamed protein product [Adineta ricciae]
MRYIALLFVLFAFIYLTQSNVLKHSDDDKCQYNNLGIHCDIACTNSMIQQLCSTGSKCCTSHHDCGRHQRCCPPSSCTCVKRCENETRHD